MKDKTDAIYPSHYKVGDVYEHVKVVRAWGLSYELGCATKYLIRAGKKDENTTVQDLRKAIRYIEMEIERVEIPKLPELTIERYHETPDDFAQDTDHPGWSIPTGVRYLIGNKAVTKEEFDAEVERRKS